MTPTSEQSVQKQSASAEERADGIESEQKELARLREVRFLHGETTAFNVAAKDIASLRLTNQRLEAEVERMKELDGLLFNLRNLTAIPPRGIKYDEGVMIVDYVQRDLLPKWEQSRLRDLESQKGKV